MTKTARSRRRARRGPIPRIGAAVLLVGLVAGALGMFGVAAVATQIAWLLFLVGIILLVVYMVTGRHGPRTL